jgi:hypothetical protein
MTKRAFPEPSDFYRESNRRDTYAEILSAADCSDSCAQILIHRGRWIHIVGVADSSFTSFYKEGQYIRCDTYRGPAQGPCEIHYRAPPNQNLQLIIDREAGPAPLRLGTKERGSFFEGGLAKVRLWNRALNAAEISALYSADEALQDSLVAGISLGRRHGCHGSGHGS